MISTRLQLHHALQVAATVGFTSIEPEEDFSHTTFSWRDGCFVGQRTPQGVCAALDPRAGRLSVGDEAFDLQARTLADAYAWLAAAIDRAELVEPAYDLPEHPVAEGEPFDLDASDAAALAGWFDLGDAAIARAVDGPRRIWPHHFDLATLVDLGDGKSIGIGLSPGDGQYPEPYFYTTPWPYPSTDTRLPDLPDGAHWHRDGWTGAVVTATALADVRDRAHAVDAYLKAARDAARGLIA
jgi:hypothetical protein